MYNHPGDKQFGPDFDLSTPLTIERIVDERDTVEEGLRYLIKYMGYMVDSDNDWFPPSAVSRKLLNHWNKIKPSADGSEQWFF